MLMKSSTLLLCALALVTPFARAQAAPSPKMEQSAPTVLINNAPRPRLRVPRARQTPLVNGAPDDVA